METLFYKDVSEFTDSGAYIDTISALPDDIERLCQFVQNLLIHAYWVEKYGFHLEYAEMFPEMQLRYCHDILERAIAKSAAQLNEPRLPKQKVASISRDFSLLLCTILRTKGVAARTRCGFATYLTPNHYEDHWICEYWSEVEMRWIMVDAQLDSVHLQRLNIDFDPLDVPACGFINAGEAWELCRWEKVAPDKFGILNINGLEFIKGNVIRDLYSLNKIEMMAWDSGWGILKNYVATIANNDEMMLLDDLALVSKTSNFEKAKQAVQSLKEIKLPSGWCLSQCPTITDLYALPS